MSRPVVAVSIIMLQLFLFWSLPRVFEGTKTARKKERLIIPDFSLHTLRYSDHNAAHPILLWVFSSTSPLPWPINKILKRKLCRSLSSCYFVHCCLAFSVQLCLYHRKLKFKQLVLWNESTKVWSINVKYQWKAKVKEARKKQIF